MAVYDCTIFFNELDILLLRLIELSPVVDRFVIVEATRTFQGEEKPVHLETLPAELTPFADKIDHIVVDDVPHTSNPWLAEYYVRDAVVRGLEKASDDDIVIVADVDEIPRRETMAQPPTVADGDVIELQMTQLLYGFSWTEARPWRAARVVRRSTLRYVTAQEVRSSPYPTASLATAGWHLTSFYRRADRVDAILDKMRAVSHTELVQLGYDDPRYLDLCVRGGSVWSSQPKFSRPLRFRPDVSDSPVALHDPAHAEYFAPYVTPVSERDTAAEREVRKRYLRYRLTAAARPWQARAGRLARRVR